MRRVEFRSVFHAPPRKFKILAILDILAHGKSYEHSFTKKLEGHILCTNRAQIVRPWFHEKCDGHKLCAKCRAESTFDRFFVHRLRNSKYRLFPTYYPMESRMSMISQKNSTVISLREVVRRVKFRSIFRAPSRKFKILAIPYVLAHGKSYEHSFTKKLNGHILCANHA
ncbi:hypothetical protein BHE74_00057841 [Ensete ventricosum]|nr:hypothetical protein BHE74_00057841 [Ensete ventricosum]RZS28537.1 hypothetical protein BHM03_00062139 [Ensete ventricosum]